MGRHMDRNVMRGVTAAHELREAGVNFSLSTNNVLNPFTPFGDCSLIRMANLYANVCVLCLPTSPRVAPPRNTPTDDLEIRFRHQAMCLLCIAGLGGLPQISLPLATFEGLPLGLALVGPGDGDVALPDLAQRVAAPA